MTTLLQRLAKLERQGADEGGAAVWGIRIVYHATGTGPDAVRVPPTGETLSEAEFRRRFPRALLIARVEYGTPPDDNLRPA